jgi:PAS domain-containing protein
MPVQVLCAWCNTTIREGDAHKESSHGICFACVQGMGLFPTEDIGGLSQEQLDALPIGVIELDRSGVVRRYNATEARAAGLDAQRVVGRHFFTEVAPCNRRTASATNSTSCSASALGTAWRTWCSRGTRTQGD